MVIRHRPTAMGVSMAAGEAVGFAAYPLPYGFMAVEFGPGPQKGSNSTGHRRRASALPYAMRGCRSEQGETRLLDMLEVTGDTITIDAMGCQTTIAEKIREEGGNYVLAVKENQPALYQDIKDYFEYLEGEAKGGLPTDIWQSELEKDHGRTERRQIRTEEDIQWLSSKAAWKDLQTIIAYRCRREVLSRPLCGPPSAPAPPMAGPSATPPIQRSPQETTPRP